MRSEKFIRCSNCEAIHHVTPFDRVPLYLDVGGEVREVATDDAKIFMRQHAGHRLEALTSTSEAFFPHGSCMDPMAVGYIEVTNGRESFLLRRARKSVAEPLAFERVAGCVREVGVNLEVQENEIRKEMKHHFSWWPSDPLDDAKICLFSGVFKKVVEQLDPRTVRIGEWSHADDNIAYGIVDTTTIESLIAQCRPHFSPIELESLGKFIEAHRVEGGVMTLLVRRQLVLEQ